MWLAYTILWIILCFMGLNQTYENNYGPYTLSWEKFETCKGPKQGDCGKIQIENLQNLSDVIFLLDFSKDCPATSAKVTISSVQDDKKEKKLWNYALNKPCQHFVLGPILVQAFNLTTNCKIDKGRYEIHINFREKTTMFLGSSFFYGTYAFKTMSFNKNDNFFCLEKDPRRKKNTKNIK